MTAVRKPSPPPDTPIELFECFMRPCDIPVTCRIYTSDPTLKHVFACYKHATSVKAMLIDSGFTDAVLRPVNEPPPRLAPVQPPLMPYQEHPGYKAALALNHDPSVPECMLAGGSSNTSHPRGVLLVRARLIDTPDVYEYRVCTTCIFDFGDVLRNQGYTSITIAAPEFPQHLVQPWKG